MADQRDFDLLDDYLTHRMGEQDRSAFEQRIKADPDLQHEYALQTRMIKAIKDARVAELKSMLNNVPVPANHPGNTVVPAIILGTVLSLMIAAGFWYFRDGETRNAEHKTTTQETTKTETSSAEQLPAPAPAPQAEDKSEEKPVQKQTEQPVAIQKPRVPAGKNQTSAGTEHSKPSLAGKPASVHAPAPEARPAVKRPATEDANNTDYQIEKSPVLVETRPEDARYTFHYQLKAGKLALYGPFNRESYDVLSFKTGLQATLVLYFSDNYYFLQEQGDSIQPLEPVSDQDLRRRLDSLRTSN